jgi:hypothetical protein
VQNLLCILQEPGKSLRFLTRIGFPFSRILDGSSMLCHARFGS